MISTRRFPMVLSAVSSLALGLLTHAAHAASQPLVAIDPATQVSEDPRTPGQYGGFHEPHGDGMVGWRFELLEPVTVTRVGWYDEGQDGLSRPFQVGLWAGPTAQLLGVPCSGVIIPGGTEAALDGPWRVVDLPTPLMLRPGGYVLGGVDTEGTPDVIWYAAMDGFEREPSLAASRLAIGTIFAAGFYHTEPGFHFPTFSFLVDGLELGPMLFIDVPEPSSVTLLGLGLLGLAIRRLDP